MFITFNYSNMVCTELLTSTTSGQTKIASTKLQTWCVLFMSALKYKCLKSIISKRVLWWKMSKVIENIGNMVWSFKKMLVFVTMGGNKLGVLKLFTYTKNNFTLIKLHFD